MKSRKIKNIPFCLLLLHLLFAETDLFAQSKNFPIVNSAISAPHRKKSSLRYHTMQRRVQYIGRVSDSLSFIDNSLILVENYRTATVGMRSSNEPQYADSGLVISIDTTQLIGISERISSARNSASGENYDAYPVTIQNVTTNPLIVGTGLSIPIVIEALDQNSNWRTVDGPITYARNFNDDNIVLQPGDIVGVAVTLYSGSFQTLIRIRVFGNYSEPFIGFLNPTQLIEPVQ